MTANIIPFPVRTAATVVERLSPADTAKQLKRELREAFPGVAFSVRLSRGTGYGYCYVSWTDGPSDREVDAITSRYETQGFDGMTDSTYSIKAEVANSGLRGVSTTRNQSEASKAAAAAELVAAGYALTGHGWQSAVYMIANGWSVEDAAHTHSLRKA